MESFSRKEIKNKTLGERLREIREKKGFSIEEASKVTKIHIKYLQYLETDKYNELPSEVYIRGFLKNYSSFLGVRDDDVLRIYDKEKKIAANLKKDKDNDKVRKKKRKKIPIIILPFKALIIIISSIFFIGIGWYFYVEAGKFAEAPRLLIYKPLNNFITKDTSTEIIGTTDVGSQVAINGKNIFVNDQGEFKERVSLKEGVNKLIITAVNKFNKKIEKELNISAQYDKKQYLSNESGENSLEKKSPKSNKIQITIKAQDSPVWLLVKVDGEKKYSGTILANTEQTFEGENEIVITSGMANKTFIKRGNEGKFHQLADVSGVIRDVVFKKEDNEAKN